MLNSRPPVVTRMKATVVGRHAVTIGANCVVHPLATIDATRGPVTFGDNCVVDELCMIINACDEGESLVIGNNNYFSVGSHVRLSKLGDANVFGVKCRVDAPGRCFDGCFFGACCTPALLRVCAVGSHECFARW